jgi:hypothetical protein
MNTKQMIEAMQAYEDGKEVSFKFSGTSESWIVDKGHMWRSDIIYFIKQQPKTVTIFWYLIDGKVQGTDSSRLALHSVLPCDPIPPKPFKTETIEVSE